MDYWQLVFLYWGIGILVTMIIEKDTDIHGIIEIVIFIALGAFSSLGVLTNIKQGVDVTYKETITDFNEVYDNGYEITGQDGEIYILEKADE